MEFKQWEGFNTQGEWTKEIDVRGLKCSFHYCILFLCYYST